jgi:hypothetical protein
MYVIETEHHVDDRHSLFYRDPLKRIRDGAAEILCMVRFPLQNDAAGNHRIGPILRCKLPHDHWNLERAWYAVNRNGRIRRKRAQLFGSVIDKPLHVLRIKLARDDTKTALGLGEWWMRRCSARHLKMTNDE